MNLPLRLTWEKASDRWSAIITPFLNLPANNNLLLSNISLIAGANVVNHRLGRKLQGWYIVRKRASSDIYDTQDTNETPDLTLNLTADNPVVIDLVVF